MSDNTPKTDVALICGRSNLPLAKNIEKLTGIKLIDTRIEDFGNTEIKIEINESIRGRHVYLLQTGAFTQDHSVNDFTIELLGLVDACKRSSATSITVVIPCFPYARSDKKDHPRVPIMAALIAKLLKGAGCTRIVALDLHAGQIQGMTDIPFDNIYGKTTIVEYLNSTLFKNISNEIINAKYILASADTGGIKRLDAFAHSLKMDSVVMHKRRDHSKTSVILNSVLIGKDDAVKDKVVILVDDMVDTCGTMISAVKELKNNGAISCIIIATHGIFSKDALTKLNECEFVDKVIVTDSLPQEMNAKICKKIEIIDISNLMAETIKRLVSGNSIEAMFTK